MQCATHAISKQSLIPLSGWHPGERRQSTTERKAPALSWLRKPAITINLSSDYQSDHNWINERNKSIASLLGLALKRGLISPAKVESLLTLSNSTKLIETVHNTISDIGDWMQKIGTTNTGDEVSLPAFDLDVIPLDNGQSAIVLLFRDFYAVEIPANKLPPVIASSLYISFDMLVHLGFGCVTRDLIGSNPWYQNISDEITAIDQAGLINRPEDAWQFAMASDFECVDEIEEDCFNAFLEQYKECSELNKPVWRDGSDPIVKLNYRSQADALIERVWGWRKNNPDLYHSPWTSLIRGIAQDVRKMKDIPTEC